jgi:hypothetical protein
MPDIMLIDVPACFAGATLPLRRYYPIILENAEERAELGAFSGGAARRLGAPRSVRSPSLERRQRMRGDRPLSATLPDWPWILLCQWPEAYTALAPPEADLFARGIYTIEVTADRSEMIRMENQLRAVLKGRRLGKGGDDAPTLATPDRGWGQASGRALSRRRLRIIEGICVGISSFIPCGGFILPFRR